MSTTVPVDYPGKKLLTEAEQNSVLRNGPSLEWFKPWLRETALRFPDMAKGGYGYAHLSGGSEGPAFQIDVRTFHTREDLQWALDTLHGLRARCDDKCDALFYWTPDTVASGPVVAS
jgi:hypothetical protein